MNHIALIPHAAGSYWRESLVFFPDAKHDLQRKWTYILRNNKPFQRIQCLKAVQQCISSVREGAYL